MSRDNDLIRSLIRDENEMTNHRMNWFLLLQGLMFASLGFAWEKNSALCIIFSCVGTLSSISTGVLLHYGILAIKNLEESIQDNNMPLLGRAPKETSKVMHFLLPWHFLPVLMSVAWLAIICIKIFNIS